MRLPIARAPVNRPAETDSDNTGSVELRNTVSPAARQMAPKIGSPEWEREEALRKKRDREVERSMRSICSGC